jgi:hypothetical protein
MKKDRGISYSIRNLDKALWLKARASALIQDKTIAVWLNEAIKDKLDKELKRG